MIAYCSSLDVVAMIKQTVEYSKIEDDRGRVQVASWFENACSRSEVAEQFELSQTRAVAKRAAMQRV